MRSIHVHVLTSSTISSVPYLYRYTTAMYTERASSAALTTLVIILGQSFTQTHYYNNSILIKRKMRGKERCVHFD